MSPPREPLLVLFDLDGTLAATAPDIVNAINLLLAESGVPPMAAEDAATHVGSGAGAETLIGGAFARAGRPLSPEESRHLLVRYFEIYLKNLCVQSTLYEGCTDALDHLIARGHRLAVCTNKPTRHARALLERLEVADRFAAICGRDLFEAHKPDPRHVDGTIERAGGRDRRAILVGDSETDVAAARNAGIPVVLVSFGYGAGRAAALSPEATIDHFRDLPGLLESFP